MNDKTAAKFIQDDLKTLPGVHYSRLLVRMPLITAALDVKSARASAERSTADNQVQHSDHVIIEGNGA
jgi:hypothetical protein